MTQTVDIDTDYCLLSVDQKVKKHEKTIPINSNFRIAFVMC